MNIQIVELVLEMVQTYLLSYYRDMPHAIPKTAPFVMMQGFMAAERAVEGKGTSGDMSDFACLVHGEVSKLL